MRSRWPEFDSSIYQGTLVCAGELQPSPINRVYKVRIVLGRVGTPRAYVDEPPLRRRESDEPIPHVYAGPRPCLYLPGVGEWRPDRLIADTIVPWLALWLVYYEIWHTTGKWLGGGAHPGGDGKIELPSE